jgi:hypothetical protein
VGDPHDELENLWDRCKNGACGAHDDAVIAGAAAAMDPLSGGYRAFSASAFDV